MAEADQLALDASVPVGADTSGTVRDLHADVHGSAEAVQRLNDRARERGSVACGRALIERSAGSVGVVKSVRGAVPVSRPARFIEPLPETAVR